VVIEPDGSTRNPAVWSQRTATRISSSVTDATSCTMSRINGQVSVPTDFVSKPSARLAPPSSVLGPPAAIAAESLGIPAGSAAITRTLAPVARTAEQMPASRPPPPIGTMIVRTSGHWSRISIPTVPCPAITSG